MIHPITSYASQSVSAVQPRQARGLEFALEGTQGTLQPEMTEEEKAVASATPITSPKQLTDEEKERLEYLRNQLESLMMAVAENPSDENKAHVREIESEIQKITGIKTQSKLSKLAAKLPQEKDKKDDPRDEGVPTTFLPEKLAAKQLPDSETGPQPGVPGPGLMTQMMKASASYFNMERLTISELKGSALQSKI